MVVAFPIALYSTSLICDLLYAVIHDPFWFKMAFWAIAFGVVTNIGAAATGLPDFLAVMRERTDARRPATSHLVFGVSLLVLQSLNLVLRNGGEPPAGGSTAMPLLVNVVAAGLLGVQGWYGGELIYRYFIGVELPELKPDHTSGKKARKH
ncbi:MAG: DUF2231 domain-containing protein, partial [Nitrospiraceae bacterium]